LKNCRPGLVVIDFRSFVFLQMFKFLPHSWWVFLVGYKMISWEDCCCCCCFVFFQYLKYTIHCLLAYKISAEKSTNNLVEDPYMLWVSFATSRFYLSFSVLIICCHMNLVGFILFRVYWASSICISLPFLKFEFLAITFFK
jgi:hypothetical protein